MTSFLIIVIILALIFDFINGFHDAANSIATIVSTKVLTPFQAVLWAAFFNCVAFMIFKDHAVANTIGKTVYSDFITIPVIFSGLVAAIIWNLLTWWYGIPSSSSHTLIGGFAGSAVAYAFLSKGMMPINEIIDGSKIGKTLLFILVAPVLGMFISIIFTLIFIQRNTWLKVGILAGSAVGLYFLFIGFQEDKMKENMAKFFKVDKYSIEVNVKHDSTKVAKLEKAIASAEACDPYLSAYELHGSDRVVDNIFQNVDLRDITISRLGDKLNTFYKIDQLKNRSKLDPSVRDEYEATKIIVDSLKPITKKYFELGPEGMVAAMNAKYPISPDKANEFSKAMKIDIRADLKKEIVKADNMILRCCLVGALLIFCFMFIYNEKIKEPTAKRVSHMFKRAQLLSSAAFSIGHGGNDAQKVMGIIAAALVANGNIVDIKSMPDWVPISCYLAIGIGTLSGGWKIVKTMGTKITKVTPLEGVCAETAGATTLFLTEQMGIPVSTTHTITGAIIGVGATKSLSAVKWGVTVSLLWAWILTIPISAILGALTYFICSLFGG
ncbi:MAG: inorganic phosphate transporter [Bacteroidota bacterium]|jgi:PiT family inorganic phosphate transporter|nr:inorganic phosphate transporter [Bacteroidota bacterium]